jgi:outer membrane protein TolC
VTLDDAIQLALENAPSMRNSQNSLRSARMALTQRYSAFLPRISTSAGFRPAQNGGDARFDAGISASVSLFNPQQYFAIAQAKRQLEVSEASALTSTYQLRTQVKQQFFAAQQSQEALAASQRQLLVVEAQMELVRVRVRTGYVVVNDSLNTLISLLSAQDNVQTAENNVANSIRNLSRTLGLNTLVRPDPRDSSEFAIIQIDSVALVGMLVEAPAALQSRAQIANSKASLRDVRLRYIPSIGGSISMSRSGSGQGFYGFGAGQYRYSGGQPGLNFSFSLPIFDGFGREASLVNAREAVETAELNYRDQQRDALNSLYQAIANIRSTERTLKRQEMQIGIAEENLRIVNIRFELDAATPLEVMTALNSLFNATNSLVNTRNTYRNQIATLEQTVGRDIR